MTQSQTAALPRHKEEEETDKTKQAQIEQTYEKHKDYLSLPQAISTNLFRCTENVRKWLSTIW